MLILILLGLFAGALTTLAGMGGGLVLLLGLSLVYEPITALAITGPALLIGNLHRVGLYWRDIDRGLVGRYALGAAPGALLGGLVAVSVPATALQVGMVLLAGLAAAKVLLGWRFTPPRGALVPGGAAVGFVSATSGGGGLIAGPMLLASGLTGRPYVGTAAVGAAAVHVFRLTGYGAGGLLGAEVLGLGLVGAVCITAGNLAGERARAWLPEGWGPRLEVGVVALCLGLALAGL